MTFQSALSNIQVSKEPVYIKELIPAGHTFKADSDGFFIDGGSIDPIINSWVNLNSDVYNNELIPNSWYLINSPFYRDSINDSGNIFVKASSTNSFFPQAFYEAYIPDYQTYTLWNPSTSNSIVIWDGTTWNYVSGSKSEEPGVGSVWLNIGNSVLEWDEILYDFHYDVIIRRVDRRNNVVSQSAQSGNKPISNFPWGNYIFHSNTINDSVIELQNCPAIIFNYNSIINNSTVSTNIFGSNVSFAHNIIDHSSVTNNTFLDGSTFNYNHLMNSSSVSNNEIKISLDYNNLTNSTISNNNISIIVFNKLYNYSRLNNNTSSSYLGQTISFNNLSGVNTSIENNVLDGNNALLSLNTLFENSSIQANIFSGSSSQIVQNVIQSSGFINNCTLNNNSIIRSNNIVITNSSIQDKILNTDIIIDGCIFETTFSGIETLSSNITAKKFKSPKNLVIKTINITGLTSINLSDFGFAESFLLTSSNSSETLNQVTIQEDKKITLTPDIGLTLTLTGTSVGSATTNDIVLKSSAASIVLNGTNGDWIELIKFDNYNGTREINIGIY